MTSGYFKKNKKAVKELTLIFSVVKQLIPPSNTEWDKLLADDKDNSNGVEVVVNDCGHRLFASDPAVLPYCAK